MIILQIIATILIVVRALSLWHPMYPTLYTLIGNAFWILLLVNVIW